MFLLGGPTASGKTAVAHLLAERMGARVLSADSMLIYRGMDIGTAKPSVSERNRFHYAGLDGLDPSETGSTGLFLDQARRALDAAPVPSVWLVVGGTGLYFKALLEGLPNHCPPSPQVREQVRNRFEREGLAGLQEWLRALAPERWTALRDPENPRRLMRALELVLEPPTAGTTPKHSPAPDSFPEIVVLRPEREWLRARIRSRAEAMFSGGLIEEVRALRGTGRTMSETARHAIGYREAGAVLDGEITVAQAVDQTFSRTWQYARRQMTWFRHQARVAWLEVGAHSTLDQTAAAVHDLWQRHGPVFLAI